MTFRADNIGSLLRPDYLKAARASFDAGTLSAEGFKQVEDRAVDAAIAMQEAVGLDVVTDGELRRHTFFDQLRGAMHGTIEFAHPAAGVTFHAERSADDIEFDGAAGLAVVEKIRRNRTVTVEEFVYVARIDEAARHFPREQLALSTQCGFAPIMDGNEISEESQEGKLELVARVAHEAWG